VKIIIKTDGIAAVAGEIQALNAQLLPKASMGLARGLQQAVSIAQTKFLSGPRPQRLDKVTGRLLNSITHRVVATETGLLGMIGTNIPYAAYHELGFKGTVNVKAHTRSVSELHEGRVVDTRRPIRDRAGRFIAYKETRTQSAERNGTISVSQQVRAHTRTVNYAGRPFLRPALIETLPLIVRQIREAVATP